MASPIQLQSLTRSYGNRRGVIDLDLTVNPGEIFGFLGPNGAGKSTTIRVLMGLLRPTSGAARLEGLDCWAEAARVKAKVGFLPGDLRLYEQMTGARFLEFFAGFRPDSRERRRELVERLELDLTQRIKAMSKGNRQKLAIVQALMYGAPVLLLDEPSSGLDPLMEEELLKLLREERDAGRTVFLSSHLLWEVEQIADRVGIIRDGRLVAVDTMEHLRSLRERPMEIILSEPTGLDGLRRLDGVRVRSVEDGGRRVTLSVRGPIAPLLGEISRLPVADLTYGPPDLESLFMQYYAGAGPEKEGITA
jgi:ABC-2 type transport system ATP-binding protein